MAIEFYDRRTGATTPVKTAHDLGKARGFATTTSGNNPKTDARVRAESLSKNPPAPGKGDIREIAERRSNTNTLKQRNTDRLVKSSGVFSGGPAKPVSPKKAAKASAERNVRMASQEEGRRSSARVTTGMLLKDATQEHAAGRMSTASQTSALKRDNLATKAHTESATALDEMKTAASKAGVRKGKINNIAKLSSGKTTYKTKGQAKRAGRALAKLK